MKACAVMSMDKYEDACVHVTRAINILEHARVSKADRDTALNSLYEVRVILEEEED